MYSLLLEALLTQSREQSRLGPGVSGFFGVYIDANDRQLPRPEPGPSMSPRAYKGSNDEVAKRAVPAIQYIRAVHYRTKMLTPVAC